jgi:hypothetical protein
MTHDQLVRALLRDAVAGVLLILIAYLAHPAYTATTALLGG